MAAWESQAAGDSLSGLPTSLKRGPEVQSSEVSRLVASRHSSKVIAKGLGVSLRTVTMHITNIYGKLEVNSRGEFMDLVRA